MVRQRLQYLGKPATPSARAVQIVELDLLITLLGRAFDFDTGMVGFVAAGQECLG